MAEAAPAGELEVTVIRARRGPLRLLTLATVRALMLALVWAPSGPPFPVRAQRRWFDLVAPISRPRHRVRRATVDAGGVPAERVDGSPEVDRHVVLYLHGGAYCLHSPRVYRPLTASLAHAAEATVYALDYRRAPEHSCPAALEDALAAYRWLLDRGVDPGRIAFAGDSAGGGLSVAAAVAIRDAGLPMPSALALISPWVDLGLTGDSMRAMRRYEVVMRGSWLEASSRMYRDGLPVDEPRCSPLFADLSGLPPTLIQSGGNDILLSDSERIAGRLAESGVDVRLEVHERMQHVFQDLPGVLPEAEAALQRLGEFVREPWTAAAAPSIAG